MKDRNYNDGGDSNELFDVAFQHNQKLLQVLASFRRGVGMLNAVLHVGVNQGLGQGLDGLARGHQLHEDFRTVTIFLQHPLNRVHLADNAAHPKFLRVAFAAGMAVLFHANKE